MKHDTIHSTNSAHTTAPPSALTKTTAHSASHSSGDILKAIDLYSGIGGWSLGLTMAGIQVVASYERDAIASDTQIKNQASEVFQCDIRKKLPYLPNEVDFVVGSPPCTEFSLSNKGGNGDIENGLKDISRFLDIVNEMRPRYWVLENVPRLKKILNTHVHGKKGKLRRFRHLFEGRDVHVQIIDMSKFGLPQRRIRCIAGRFPAELLNAYAEKCPSRTLGSILQSLNADESNDSNYGFSVDRQKLTEHEPEMPLSREEVRLNRDSKYFHPVYNRMEFPDRSDRPVRAITATCTRVSRESIIINVDGADTKFRRLTIRERACLQGFPITYQFYANSYSKKIEMIGNAIPPLFVYYIGCALKGVKPSQLMHPDQIQFDHATPPEVPPLTQPARNVRRYPLDRRFRAAIPFLRFKSGVGFELANKFDARTLSWRMAFFFGNSKDIRILRPDGRQNRQLENFLRRCRLLTKVKAHRQRIVTSSANVSASSLQQRWIHLENGSGPHSIVHKINVASRRIAADLKTLGRSTLLQGLAEFSALEKASESRQKTKPPLNRKKFENNVAALLAGLIIASWYNSTPSVSANKPAAWKSKQHSS